MTAPDEQRSSLQHELTGIQMLRIVLLVSLGTLFCSATVVSLPIVVTHMVRVGSVHGIRDLVSEFMFFVFSVVLLGVTIRAWLRVRRASNARANKGSFDWLARGVPVFVVIGAGVGVWFGLKVNREHDATVRSLAESTCVQALGFDADEQKIEACVPIGIECDKVEDVERRAKGIGIGGFVGDDRPSLQCVRARFGVAERK